MVLGRLRSLWKGGFDTPLAPEEPICVIGDVHGCAGLLDRLLDRLVQELPAQDGRYPRLIFAGDYVDRGEDTAGVLARLPELEHEGWPGEVTCLKGNHESMLVTFLDDPIASGPDWIHSGGLHTLASFRLTPPRPTAQAEAWVELRDGLAEAMGETSVRWMRDLPLSWRSGNVLVAHAAADPERPVEAQEEDVLLWGHPDFFEVPRKDGIWVIHGHTIQASVEMRQGRIGVDTGAYATGRLSAAVIGPDGLKVMST
jgi:serine/threonine protein phosphatase 1